jgi:hypothetical protein
MHRGLIPLAIALFLSSAARAGAQEAGQTGLTVADPSSVGIVWQASDRLAVRPDLSFSTTSSDSGGIGLGGSETSQVGTVGVSVLYGVGRWDALRTYVAPRFGYTRSSLSVASLSTADTHTSTYVVSGSFGASYALGRRFGVFAEVGMAYSGTSNSSTTLLSSTNGLTVHTWATRSGVGAIIFFK